MIFIYTQPHETIMFMEYQMRANTVVLSRASLMTRGMHVFFFFLQQSTLSEVTL